MNLAFEILGDMAEELKRQQTRVEKAANAAVHDAAKLAKDAGASAMSAGGFSKFSRAFGIKYYGGGGPSPAAYVFNHIPYASVFETGMVISGKPLLWLPLKDVPIGRGGKPLSPKEFVAQIGPLKSINVPGKPPLLAGASGIIRASAKSVRFRKSALRRAGGIRGVAVPMYVGISSVTEPKRYNATAAMREAASHAGEIYVKYFNAAGE